MFPAYSVKARAPMLQG